MKLSKYLVFLLVLPLFAFATLHKYYISVTQVNYVKEKQSIQIISRVFIDDFENTLQKRFDENIILAEDNESKIINTYIETYIKENFTIKINNKASKLIFIGKEYEGDIMRFYLEVEDVNHVENFEISNKVLFDLLEDQQNIVKLKINAKQKSFIQTLKKPSSMLNFI